MSTSSNAIRSRFARRSVEADERFARYAYFSPLIEGAQVIELLGPKQAQFPGAAFLEASGASSAVSIICTPEEPPTDDVLDSVAAKSVGETPLIFVDDAAAWLSAASALQALTSGIDKRLPRANFIFTFRNPAGTSLAAFGGADFSGGLDVNFVFSDCERQLTALFSSVQFAAQCALWGSQIAPLAPRAELESAIDGRLGDQPKAAFFIALCSNSRGLHLPEEITIIPLSTAPLSTGAERLNRMADALRRSESERRRLSESLSQKLSEERALNDLKKRAISAEKEAADAGRQSIQAEEKLKRVESLLDEVAEERSGLVERMEKSEAKLAECNSKLEEKERLLKDVTARMEQAEREREAHLALSQSAMKQLQEKASLLADENKRLKLSAAPQSPNPAADAGNSGGEKARNAGDSGKLFSLEQELLSRDARIKTLEAILQRQDACLAELETAERDRRMAGALSAQSEAKSVQLEAQLAARDLKIGILTEGIGEVMRAVRRLNREKSGEAIRGVIEAADGLASDMEDQDFSESTATEEFGREEEDFSDDFGDDSGEDSP